MAVTRPRPTQVERYFDNDEIIVSKTDLKGKMTYVNRVFMKISGYTEEELLGQPHSMIRHPDMPRCVFQLLWEQIASGREIFAYVKNMARNGDHYWVHAHVTPTRNSSGQIIGYHSNRRVPERAAVKAIAPLYEALRVEEERYPRGIEGMAASRQILQEALQSASMPYDEWVFSLQP